MFKLNENYEVDRKSLKYDYIRYSPAETSTTNGPNSKICINIPREDSVISLLNSYLDMNFEVIKRADNSRYANGIDIRLVYLAPFSLFSNFKLTTSSGKHLENISHAHIVSLMYRQITSTKTSDDLSTGFDRSLNRRRNELINIKNLKGKYNLQILLKDVFGFAEHHDEANYGLGYKLTLTRNKDDSVIDKAAGVVDYTPSIQQHGILSKQFLSKTPTELRYVERSFFLKEVNNQNLWRF